MASEEAMIAGEIKIGDTLIWEPTDPGAYEVVTVTDIKTQRGVVQVETKGIKGRFWNNETRVREACIRHKVEPEPGTGKIKGKFQAVQIR